MLVLLKSYLKWLNRFVRFFYWQYRWLHDAKTGKGGSIELPLRFEGGGGMFVVGDNYKIEKGVYIGIAKNAIFQAKNKLFLREGVDVRVGVNSKLIAGNNLVIYPGAVIAVKNIWEWGDDVNISANATIGAREGGYFGKLTIGNGSQIGDNSLIDVSGDITIGVDSSVGPNCVIYTHNHLYTDKTKAAWKGGIVTKPVVIEDGVWIAAGVMILPGVTIGKNAVIASGAIVTHDVEAYSLYGGVPAKLIKYIQ